MSAVEVRTSGRVGTVTLNRPEKLNAMDFDVFVALGEAGARLDADPEVRAVVLRGEGRAFSSGLDLSAFATFGEASAAELNDRVIPAAQQGFRVWTSVRKPVIAAVQGYALGAGFQLALAADLRLTSPGSTWSLPEIKYGIIPDLGATQRLPRLIGPARTKDLIWTARRIDGIQALDWGLANELVESENLDDRAMQLAQELAAKPPLPIAYTKKLVDDSATESIFSGMDSERHAQMVCMLSDDSRLAMKAAMADEPGEYKGR